MWPGACPTSRSDVAWRRWMPGVSQSRDGARPRPLPIHARHSVPVRRFQALPAAVAGRRRDVIGFSVLPRLDRPGLLSGAIDCRIAPVSFSETGDLRDYLLIMLGELTARLGAPVSGPMMMSLIAEALRDPQMAEMKERFTTERFGRIRSILEVAFDRGDLPVGINLSQMGEDLVAPLFFRALVRRSPLDPERVEHHVDRWIAVYRG